jgi:serine/threonine protein kinase
LADQVLVSALPNCSPRQAEITESLQRLAAVASEHLLAVFEVLAEEGSPNLFLASEAHTRGTLATTSSPLEPQAKALAIAAGARGAHDLHEAGIAHGSFAPNTIFLTSRGPLLGPPDVVSPPGRVTGSTPPGVLNCVDPALLRGEAPSRASDIWSVGATLHVSLSSEPLYPGLDDDEPVMAVQRVLYSRPRLDPKLPGPILDIIRSCLAADPSKRPSTALNIAEKIESYEWPDSASQVDVAAVVTSGELPDTATAGSGSGAPRGGEFA